MVRALERSSLPDPEVLPPPTLPACDPRASSRRTLSRPSRPWCLVESFPSQHGPRRCRVHHRSAVCSKRVCRQLRARTRSSHAPARAGQTSQREVNVRGTRSRWRRSHSTSAVPPSRTRVSCRTSDACVPSACMLGAPRGVDVESSACEESGRLVVMHPPPHHPPSSSRHGLARRRNPGLARCPSSLDPCIQTPPAVRTWSTRYGTSVPPRSPRVGTSTSLNGLLCRRPTAARHASLPAIPPFPFAPPAAGNRL
ncbi:uncharacterized protein B0H18DRAFT_684834 [Fomitopsis serialis]|uniref:uncharacterized protein n=1 Tax=Fomitopsis serialis TaxID=139415 RepID=UPI002008CDC9|nr:uncharacterized protein B0H18DRAFT_684834 [Neoantrodia serialis]KAH9918030.1 hypothetical protein B0H18DRAFT_684834 [Neoantrodia serialis]